MQTILVIDDDPPITDLLSEALEVEGYEVVAASDGREGLDRLADASPDLVLCDVMMPVLDGCAVAAAMHAKPDYRSIPLILMSAVPETSLSPDVRYGAFLRKPFDLDDLVAVVQRLLGSPPRMDTGSI